MLGPPVCLSDAFRTGLSHRIGKDVNVLLEPLKFVRKMDVGLDGHGRLKRVRCFLE